VTDRHDHPPTNPDGTPEWGDPAVAPPSPRVLPPVSARAWPTGATPPTPPPTGDGRSSGRSARASGRGWLVVALVILALALVAAGYLVGQASQDDRADLSLTGGATVVASAAPAQPPATTAPRDGPPLG
jgi:hypothetical protein